ncbi:MAG TPA: porphobilinogen synthase [Rhabdochlamydiaceae bacterium]
MILKRPRRNRRTPSIRSMVAETTLLPADLVAPFFVLSGENQKQPIGSMPGISRLSIDHILTEAEKLHAKGIPAIALFPVTAPEFKDLYASEALNPNGVIPQAVRRIKNEIPSLSIITDIALDPFTSHGHDGLLSPSGVILNDDTVAILIQMALLHAESGADFVAPSDMMDGRVGAIRRHLDTHSLHDTGILSYTAKYASALYAPFREALGSTLKQGDKKTYQMNPANIREALLEATLDEEEGADMLLVKPALYYLDIISKFRAHSTLPICAFHVSGEYSMVMAAHERGFLDAQKVFYEALLSIKRAGADFIISYATPQVLELL